jgi:hypothetical protein
MDYVPPVGWADIATKRDLEMLRLELHSSIKDLKAALLMWMVPTIIGSVGIAVTLARV